MVGNCRNVEIYRALARIAIQSVSRIAGSAAGSVQNMGVNHRGTKVLVAHEFVKQPNGVAADATGRIVRGIGITLEGRWDDPSEAM